MISGNTYRLITGFFILEDQGPQILKGITTPLRLYRVEGPSGARNRLEAFATVQGLTPFVGREDELRTLIRRWERVREGDGQVILISGELELAIASGSTISRGDRQHFPLLD